MLNRRHFTLYAGALGMAALPTRGNAKTAVAFYASVGPNLNLYDLDADAATLTYRTGVRLPANIQYAWPHPSQKFLYVAASNGQPGSGPMGAVGGDKNHYAIAFKVNNDGTLTEHGPRRLLPVRPLHITTDHTGAFLFIAYNVPSQITVHRIMPDGTIGEEIPQIPKPDFGIYAHQVRVTPANKTLTLCSRGNDATPTKPEDPGHIEVFSFQNGNLVNLQSIAPHGNGIGFGPRHLDFHPNGRFVYVSLERENSLAVFELTADGRLSTEPLFYKSALADPAGKTKHPGQGVGPIHVHPGGDVVYQTNRGSGLIDLQGRKVSNGGENDVVVWAIDQKTGEPRLVQRVPAYGFELRTFSMDPTSRILVAASTTPMLMPDGRQISAGLSVYRVDSDGSLTFARKYDVDTSDGVQFWCGFLNMP